MSSSRLRSVRRRRSWWTASVGIALPLVLTAFGLVGVRVAGAATRNVTSIGTYSASAQSTQSAWVMQAATFRGQ